MKASNLQSFVFLSLNGALWWTHAASIPRRDIFATVLAGLALAFIRTFFCSPFQQVVMTSSNMYRVLFPILSVAETVVFLILPWSFLIQNDDNWASRLLTSHLYHIQTQIALEPFLREGYRIQHYWFILGTNALRGLGISTWVVRYYTEVRRDTSSVSFLDAYTTLAILVWLAANVIIVFVWHPCLNRKNPYKDSIVIITGAASGIGSAIAEEVVNRGAKAVVLVDRQKALTEKLATKLVKLGAEALAYEVDVRNFNEVIRVVQETKEQWGKIDFLFNNAGILIIGPIEKIGVDNFDYIFDVNVKGVHHGVQAAYPIMKKQGFGHIINTSSLLGLIPGGQWAVAYSASKHAVVGLTTNLCIEAANYGVRVFLFCPGTIETPIHTGGEYGKNLTGIPQEIWDQQVATMKCMDAKSCAVKALDAIAANQVIIVVPELPMMKSRLLYRLSPSLWLENAVANVGWRQKIEKNKGIAYKNREKNE